MKNIIILMNKEKEFKYNFKNLKKFSDGKNYINAFIYAFVFFLLQGVMIYGIIYLSGEYKKQ